MTDNQLAFKPSYKETVLYHRKINNQWLETVINGLPTDITRPEVAKLWIWLSSERAITFDIVKKYINKPWSWGGITWRVGYRDPEIICNTLDKYPWVCCGALGYDTLLKHHEKPLQEWFYWFAISWSGKDKVTSELYNLYVNRLTKDQIAKIMEHVPSLKVVEKKKAAVRAVEEDINDLLTTMDPAELSAHPKLTLEIVKNNPKIKWNRKIVAANLNVKLAGYDLAKLKMPVTVLMAREDLTMDIINNNPKLEWDLRLISEKIGCGKYKTLGWQDILTNPHKDWSWYQIDYFFRDKPAAQEELIANIYNFIRTHRNDKDYINAITCYRLCRIPGMHKMYGIIQEFIDLPWDWEHISCEYELTIDDIKNSNGKIQLNDLCRSLNYAVVKAFPDFEWSYEYMRYSSKDIPTSFLIEKFGHIDAFWVDGLKYRVNDAIYEMYSDKPWHYPSISERISFDVILRHMDKPWDLAQLAGKYNLSKNVDKSYEIYSTKYLAAIRIQAWWRRYLARRTPPAPLTPSSPPVKQPVTKPKTPRKRAVKSPSS